MGNILTLVRMGYLPPNINLDELKRTIYYKIWEFFRIVCVYADFIPPKIDDIKCKKTRGGCTFDSCPVVARALKMYEQSLKF